jgi:DNA-binding SARP family transcriptional activator/Tfp pilus assembly protein PilF
MDNKVTYHQQVSYCGKPRCRKCQSGTGHGPYWYAYQTIDGRTTRKYIGKQLPPEAQAEIDNSRQQSVALVHERDQSVVRLYTLGQFRLERRVGRNGEWQTANEASWHHQRVRSLLICLICSPGRKLGREQIMEALWPDLDFDTASSRLDRAVYSLRQLFEPSRSRLADSRLLLTEREMVKLADHPQVWIDADAFEHLLAQAHATQDNGEREKLLDEAYGLYGGNLLPEVRKLDWVLRKRDALLRSWIGMLLELSDLRSNRQAANAVEPLDRLLAVDPTNEAAVQRLISLLAQQGRRGEALQAYRRLAAMLRQEYGIAPLPETRSLYEAVRRVEKALPAPQASEEATTRQIVQIGRSHQSPLVGREQEIGLLRQLITTMQDSARFKLPSQKRMYASSLGPQNVFLLGEVGIGKTRLAEEASRYAKRHNWAVAWSRAYAQEGGIPYHLWIDVLRKAMDQGTWQRQELSNRPLVFQPLNALLPELHIPQVSFAAMPSPEQEQFRLWEAISEFLALISSSTPLLIALDDMQWADGSSCELFAFLTRRLRGHPVIIIGTCRENELVKGHPLRSLMPDLQRERVLETIPLQPLSDEQIRAIVANVPDVPLTLAEDIQQRARGNPFFAEELARTFGKPPDAVSGLGTHDHQPTVLPETISAVLDLRLSRLSSPCLALLRRAAVLGSDFTFDMITAMEPNVDEDEVLELLEEALRSGMLTEEGTGTRITYRFWHPLLATHLYESQSAARRASLHRRVANILIRAYRGREVEQAATITNHLFLGGADPLQIASYAEMAGDRAYALSSYPEAEKHYRMALDHLPSTSIIMNTDGRLSDEQLRRVELLELLGECARVRGRFEEASQIYDQALHIRQRQIIIGAPEEYQREAQIQALLWCEIGWAWYRAGKNEQALQCYHRSEEILQGAGVMGGPTWAYIRYQQGHISWRAGRYEQAHLLADEVLNLFNMSEQPSDNVDKDHRLTRIGRILANDPVVLGRTYELLGLIANGAGESAEALRQLNTALMLYEQNSMQREIAVVCCNLGDLHLRRSEYEQAQANLRRSLNLAEYVGEVPLISFALNNLGILDLRQGNLIEAEADLRRSIDIGAGVDDPISASECYINLGTTLLERGNLTDASIALYRALSTSRAIHVVPYIGFALVAIGEMRIAQAVVTGLEVKNSEGVKNQVILKLHRARKTLQHVLELEDLEAQTRIEGRIALGLVMFLLGDAGSALQLTILALEEARQSEAMWLIARAQRVLGCIHVAQEQTPQAVVYFEQALRMFRKTGMRLEYARTLHQYGEALVQQEREDADKTYQRGLEYLREARGIFEKCKAELDLRVVERVLVRCEQTSKV